MNSANIAPLEILNIAVSAVRNGDAGSLSALDAMPVAVYATDHAGVISYYNPACVDFSGRRPTPGKDSWCVSWKLYTEEGDFLPHEKCPMAVAIQQKRPVRGIAAIAERPDGSRVTFLPFPTPVLDDDGEVVAAVNILVPVSDVEKARRLQVQAQRCRRLAASANDPKTMRTLKLMAAELEAQAAALRQAD
jgi:PAS domain-containing protein